jgi:O-methyltransferase
VPIPSRSGALDVVAHDPYGRSRDEMLPPAGHRIPRIAAGLVEMTRLIKRLILRLLDRLGYVLLKKPDTDTLQADASAMRPVAAPAVAISAAAAKPKRREALPDFVDPALAGEFGAICEKLENFLRIPPRRAYAAYMSARALVQDGVAGDVVDCGEGSAETLAVIATTLATLGDTSRKIVLFDVTGDPTHRPEPELALWGMNRDPIFEAKPRDKARPNKTRLLPEELVASGYPADRIEVARFPVDRLDVVGPISFLGLTSETYPSNLAAVRMLARRVSIGGVIAVEGDRSAAQRRDPVDDYLREQRVQLPFRQITSTYRIATKAEPFGEHG